MDEDSNDSATTLTTVRETAAGPATTRLPLRHHERAVIALVIAVMLVGLDVMVAAAVNPARVLTREQYLLALGDSISFGYQPNLNFGAGYVDDVFADLRGRGVTSALNLACAGETATSMIEGNCPLKLVHHEEYTDAQLAAATRFLRQHRGQIFAITLDIGANDMIGDFSDGSCSSQGNVQGDLATVDHNLTAVILPQIEDALGGPAELAAAHLVLLNYYDPFAQGCPDSTAFIQVLNAHLAADAARFRLRVADVYDAFGGDKLSAQFVCTYTWYCLATYDHDIHPTTAGYRVIAQTAEQALGYSGPAGQPFVPALPPFNSIAAA